MKKHVLLFTIALDLREGMHLKIDNETIAEIINVEVPYKDQVIRLQIEYKEQGTIERRIFTLNLTDVVQVCKLIE